MKFKHKFIPLNLDAKSIAKFLDRILGIKIKKMAEKLQKAKKLIFDDFGPILKYMKMHFSGLGVDKKVIDNGLIYFSVKFHQNPSFQTLKNGQKLSKMAKNGLKTDF